MENRGLVSLALLILRVVLGVIMVAHGLQKVGVIESPPPKPRASQEVFLAQQDSPGTMSTETEAAQAPGASEPTGLAKTVKDWQERMGIPPVLTYMAVAAEVIGGFFVLIGLLGRLAALSIGILLVVAIVKVHLSNGLFSQAGGYEFPLSLLSISIALMLMGMGNYSLDAMLAKRMDRTIEDKQVPA